jgi:hypothetical protein
MTRTEITAIHFSSLFTYELTSTVRDRLHRITTAIKMAMMKAVAA